MKPTNSRLIAFFVTFAIGVLLVYFSNGAVVPILMDEEDRQYTVHSSERRDAVSCRWSRSSFHWERANPPAQIDPKQFDYAARRRSDRKDEKSTVKKGLTKDERHSHRDRVGASIHARKGL